MNGHLSPHAALLACTALLTLCATTARAESATDVAALPATNADPVFSAALPPITSIDAGTDIRCFLAPGVPAELTRAALRRAWVTDPMIRDFQGLSENLSDGDRPSRDLPGTSRQMSHWNAR
jgi:Protein of unknown function (DUF3306)